MTDHILTIPADDAGDYTLTCPGVTDDCEGWIECQNGCDADALDAAEEDGDDAPVLHGEVHRHIDAGWSVRTGQCWIEGHPDRREAARNLGLPPGEYSVRPVYDRDLDWGALELELINTETKENAA